MFDFFDDELFTPKEQLELARYMDEHLAKMEAVLHQMEELAELAATEVSAEQRGQLQEEISQLKREIDRIADELPVAYKFPNGLEP